MVEGVDERQGRCAVKCSTVIQCSRDANRRLVDVRDAEIDFPHLEQMNPIQGRVDRW